MGKVWKFHSIAGHFPQDRLDLTSYSLLTVHAGHAHQGEPGNDDRERVTLTHDVSHFPPSTS